MKSVVPSVSVVPVCAVASVVPVCVVSRCAYTSVLKCVLRRTHGTGKRRCVRETPCMDETPCTSVPPCVRETPVMSEPPCTSETPCVDEPPCMTETPCATPRMKETPYVSGVVTGVPACVLPGTPCVKGAPQGEETTCARKAARVCEPPCVVETPRVSAPAGVSSVCVYEARVSERPNVRKAACVRSLYTREMSVAMCEQAAASPSVSMNANLVESSLGVVARRCARDEWRRRLRLWRDKSRVAAVVATGTVPGLHGSARVVRAVPRTRPPRARLRGLRPGPETHVVM